MPFENRAEAARLLVKRLGKYRALNPVVLAIPRGGRCRWGRLSPRPSTANSTSSLCGSCARHSTPELAIGSIDETGSVYLDPATRGLWDQKYLDAEPREGFEV